jgi:oligosaccharyltransferase complex subunit delta (ribophorin II)
MAKPPSSLPPTATDPLQVSLLLGSFVHDPAQFELFDVVVPASQPPPAHPDEATYHSLPEIQHTFRPEQKLPSKIISAVFTGAVFLPWPVLFFLVSRFDELLGTRHGLMLYHSVVPVRH